MPNLWDWLFNDVDWSSVSSQGRKLSHAARRNLITVSSICAIAGGLSAGVGLVGSYSPRASYCDSRTKPCTKVEVNSFDDLPVNTDAKYLPGYGLQRTAGSVLAVLLFGGGLFAIAKAEEEQEEIEPQLQLDRQLEIKRLELEANQELENLENLAQIRIETNKQELMEAQAEMFFDRNPHMVEQYLPKPQPSVLPEIQEVKPSIIEDVVNPEPEPEPEPELFFGVKLPEPPALGVEFWDWEWFNNRADDLPHIRIIAPTNGGKTTLCDWLVDVVPADERIVVTVKRKPHQWAGLEVYGVPENYSVIREKLEDLQDERVERTRLMEKGIYRGRLSAIVDEWKAIARNVKAIKDPETKLITNPSAKEIMGEQLTLSRESLIRIFAMAQGRQVVTWGLEGESDILECFCTVYLGSFAVEEAEAMGRKFSKDSEEWATWGKVVEFMRSLGKRACWVECEFGKFPAIAPDLSGWKREIETEDLTETQTEQVVVTESSQSVDLDIPPLCTPYSPLSNDVSSDEMLRQNLDRILGNLEQNLAQSPNSKDGNLGVIHSELEESEEQSELVELQPTEQVLPEAIAPVLDEKRYTPLQLTKVQLIATVSEMQSKEMSQTKIVEQLWQVQKSRSGWSKAYREFRGLGF
ncbi:hypothetical protein PQG02_32140 (plasmid) [Nostoc sp. UHCC 0926]|uniref:hypothetical protein n=1 Tax=Nostoc sp. UHCC 0926 TaxID=3025190 RepID=UPI00235E9514|nr:hypothetical protein [Nostoc sp. UHCC 0926]WDD36052.1 hypothetical protein PQG02_32140 [Nostoc sp. UHCC 0926]